MKIKKIGIVGSGVMGSGISLVSAKSGYKVVLKDINKKNLQSAVKEIENFLDKNIEKGKITKKTKKEILSCIEITSKNYDLIDCDIIIEAITENFETKKKLFQEMDAICPEEVIFASNTSAISITKLAETTKRPDRFIGMHFINPPLIMKPVEIVKGSKTSSKTIETIKKVVEKMGKEPLEIKDSPGFVLNRLLIPMINEAIYCLQEDISDKETIDKIMKLGANHPMGPLELADLIGLDICLSIMEELHKEFSDLKYQPCPLLKKMVKTKYLGRKTGKGFYGY